MLIAAQNAMLAGGGGGGDVVFATHFEVTTGSSYLTAGIYSATAIDLSAPIVVDWGDGTTDSVMGNISQLTHTYATEGVYTVAISDNISTFAINANDSSWYSSATNNQMNITRILDISENVTSIPAYGLAVLYKLTSFYAGDNGSLTLGSSALSQIGSDYYNKYVDVDLSGRTITNLASFCFNLSSLHSIQWPQGLQSIDYKCFAFTTLRWTYNDETGTYTYFEMVIPEGVTTLGSSAFHHAGTSDRTGPLLEITLPSTLALVYDKAFADNSFLGTIRCNAPQAPSTPYNPFGTGNFLDYYTGCNYASAGTNRLYVPAGATGYDSSYWLDPLQDSSKCGFTKVEA